MLQTGINDKTLSYSGAMREDERSLSTMRDKTREKYPENPIVSFLKNLFVNPGG